MATVTASTPALGSVRLNHLAALDVKGADADQRPSQLGRRALCAAHLFLHA
jgi:hypothetical protein